MKRTQSRVIAVIAEKALLAEGDYKHLVEHRLLKPETIGGNFISGDVGSLAPAFEALREQGFLDEAETTGLLVRKHGNLNWNETLTLGRILIIYRDPDGHPFHVRAHKMQMKGVPLELHGLDCLGSKPSELVITEGEFKARLLIQEGIPAISVAGIAAFVGKNYAALHQALRKAGVERCVILFDNDDRVSPLLDDERPNPKYKADPNRRYDVQYHAVQLARRLSYDGIKTDIAHLPDEWRTDGQADVDSVVRDGHTPAEIREITEAAQEPAQYLAGLSEECNNIVTKKLADGVATRHGDTLCAGQYPYKLEYTLKKGRAKGRLILRVNSRDCYLDSLNLDSAKARKVWVIDAASSIKKEGAAKAIGDLVEMMAVEYSKTGAGDLDVAGEEGPELQVLSLTIQAHPSGYYLETADGYRQISNFTAEVTAEEVHDDGRKRERFLRGTIFAGHNTHAIEMRAKDFASQGLIEQLTEQAGTSLITDEPALLRRAIQAGSDPTTTHVLQQFGWFEGDRFLTPSGQICPEGVEPIQGIKIDLSQCGKAQHLDLVELPEEELRDVTRYLFTEVPHIGDSTQTPFLLGFAFAPVISGYAVPEFIYGIHLQALSGALKTTIARALQCLYGPGFAGQGTLLSWTSTPNFLQKTGYFYNSAVAVIDDYKVTYAHRESGKQMLVQNLFDRQSRGRLRADSGFQQSYEFRGFPLSTGEDNIDSSSSNTARILPLGWDAAAAMKTPAEKVQELADRQSQFSGFTRYLVQFVQKQGRHELRKVFEANAAQLGSSFPGTANGPRLAKIIALNATSFRVAVECARSLDAISDTEMSELVDSYGKSQERLIASLCARLQGGEPAEVFLRHLKALIASRPGIVQKPHGDHFGHQEFVVHLKDDGSGGQRILVVPEVAFSSVVAFCHRGGTVFPFSQDAVGRDLSSKGVLIRKDEKHLSVQVRFGKTTVRCWELRPEALGFESKTIEELFGELELVKAEP